MTIEVMKQALEVLEYPGPSWIEARQPAITSLRQAIEQAEKAEPVAWLSKGGKGIWFYEPDASLNATPLYTATPQRQPEQGDVDWEKLYRLEVKKKEAIAAKYEQDIKPLTKIVPMAEPVVWAMYELDGKPLTDEEKLVLRQSVQDTVDLVHHGIKENT